MSPWRQTRVLDGSLVKIDCPILLLLLLLHLITHPTKCYTNSKVRALSEKNNFEQVRLQVFRKSRWTNRQVPQFYKKKKTINYKRLRLVDVPFRKVDYILTHV